MNQYLPEQRLSCCCCLKNSSSAGFDKANCRALLTIYRRELKTVARVSGCVRDGDGDASPFCDDCSRCSDGRKRGRRRAGQGARASGSPARQSLSSGHARVRRPGPDARADRSGHSAAGETPSRRASDDLPLRRADRRAAGAVSLNSSPPASPAGRNYVTLRRCSASRGSPEFGHRRLLQMPTNRMGATYWRRPSAGVPTAAAR
jgi:hypothetical protein